MTKTYWITDSRFKWISILLVFIFLVFMGVIVWQGENISKNACQICSKKMGESITCSVTNATLSNFRESIIFYPNFSVSKGE